MGGINDFAQQLSERDQTISVLSNDLLTLAARQVETYKELQALTEQLAEKDKQIQELSIRANELAEGKAQLDRINSSFGGRLLSGYGRIKYAYLLPIYRLLNLSSPMGREETLSITSDHAESADGSPDENAAISNFKLGIILPEHDLPSERERIAFFSEFGNRLCFVVNNNGRFHVFSSTREFMTNHDSLPVDYVYQPDKWNQRLTNDHFRNALLCLAHVDLDFVIVSASLATLPLIAISSIRNHLIFSKSLGLDFSENADKKAKGRVMRLLPSELPVTEVLIEEVFRNKMIDYARDPGHYTPDQGYLYIGQQMEAKSDASASEIRLTHFIPKFKKEKKLVFVLPMVMWVGGVERNTIEVMRQLKDRYHFVVITMERHDKSHGSLHHQLKGLTAAVYDLMELGNFTYYLAFLNDLKHVYEPDAVYTCNGMVWFSNHAEHVRNIFHDVPIIDQQVYDTEFGWIELYNRPGTQSFDRFVAVNSAVYRTFLERLKMNPERVDMIYPAYDSTRFGTASPAAEQEALRQAFDLARDRPLFVFCGRLTAQKRPRDFLQLALRRLQKRDDAFFVMVGTGELAPEVDEFIKDNEVANLRRIPFLDNPAPLYSIASGLIMTSQYESLGIVMLEALSMGLPVLATDVGDIRLVLEQYQAGLVVSEIGSIDSLEEAYETWRANLQLYAARARRCGPEIRQRFSSETTAEQYAVSWERAIKDFDKKK